MTLRLIVASTAIALLARTSCAQTSYEQVHRLLRSGEEDEAAALFLRAVGATTSSPKDRTALLNRGYQGFRRLGASASWLRMLDAAVASDPDDLELLWFRAYTRIDLKLLAGARQDLQRAAGIAARDDRIRKGLGWVAALSFDHANAARHFEGVDASQSAYHTDIATSLDAARGRQLIGLALGLVVVAAVASLTSWAANRSSPT